MTKARKALGQSGEVSLDSFMTSCGWKTLAANQRIRGGEIDRVYAKGEMNSRAYCVAEVKTLRVRGVHHAHALLGGDFLKSAFRRRQCRNLLFWSRLLSVRGAKKVHIRVFRLFRVENSTEADALVRHLQNRFRGGSPKILRLDPLTVAMALTPVFAPPGQATSPLQVAVR